MGATENAARLSAYRELEFKFSVIDVMTLIVDITIPRAMLLKWLISAQGFQYSRSVVEVSPMTFRV